MSESAAITRGGSSLFGKYLAAFGAVVAIPLVGYGSLATWIADRDHRASQAALLNAEATQAALHISHFMREIQGQLNWSTDLSWAAAGIDQRRLDALRLLKQVPAITDLILLDGEARERLFVSRLGLNRDNAGVDWSTDEAVVEARRGGVHYGPVYFHRETEPFMTVAIAGARREFGVVVARVNLKHIWDIVAAIRIGHKGEAYVIDAQRRLVAHPDISLVLRNTRLPTTVAPELGPSGATVAGTTVVTALGVRGFTVLSAGAPVTPLDWQVRVELPESEANELLRLNILRGAAITLASVALAMALAFGLARRMSRPIGQLARGAELLGRGELGHRIEIRSNDELEMLGDRFNAMAADLQASYAGLEQKVADRTRELADANRSKIRFIAAASHDLRQPLHALNLMTSQWRALPEGAERERLAAKIDEAVASLNGLLSGLLDISRLDAGGIPVNMTEFPISRLFARIEANHAADAARKGLSFRVVRSRAWGRSDPQLLERVLGNLVSNAIRYTRQGAVLVGCRWAGDFLHIDVMDSGSGIEPEQQQAVFGEFYRGHSAASERSEGLGLGLAIVERLCRLLAHSIELRSARDRGTRFRLTVPRVAIGQLQAESPLAPGGRATPVTGDPADRIRGSRVLVVDDDRRVLEGTTGLLSGWGAVVVAASSRVQALEGLATQAPDLIIADYHLGSATESGGQLIAELRRHFSADIPAVLVTADVSSGPRETAQSMGIRLLHKPVGPMALRALLSALLNPPANRPHGVSQYGTTSGGADASPTPMP